MGKSPFIRDIPIFLMLKSPCLSPVKHGFFITMKINQKSPYGLMLKSPETSHHQPVFGHLGPLLDARQQHCSGIICLGDLNSATGHRKWDGEFPHQKKWDGYSIGILIVGMNSDSDHRMILVLHYQHCNNHTL